MENVNGGASPQTEVVTPVATPVVETSSLKPVSGGPKKTIADVQARIADALKTAPAKSPEPEAPKEAVVETPAEPEAVAAEPAAEETPAEPEVTATEEVAPEAELEADDQGDSPITPVKSKKLRMNLPEGDEVGRLTAAFLHRNRDWSMEQAMDAAKKQLGVTTQPASAEPAKPKDGLPESVEAVDAAIDAQEAERSKALIELRFEDVAKIDSNMRRLDRQRMKLEKDGERQQVQQVQVYERAFAASDSKAVELYEFASQPDSAGSKRMLEIDADLKANGDPLYDSPDKPLRIAQMVATELKIAPRRKGTPVAPAKAAVPAVPAPKKQVLPGGGSSTTPPATKLNAVDTIVTTKRARTMQELRERDKLLFGRA